MSLTEHQARNQEDWVTNTSLEELADWLGTCKRVAVLTHSKPDGDAIGSSLALVRALRLKGIEAGAWYSGPVPPWLPDIAHEDETFQLTGGSPKHDDWDEEPDAIVVTDTGAWVQIAEVSEWLSSRHDRIAVIDHHLSGNGELAKRRVVETTAAAACQPVARLCRLLLGTDKLLPVDIAEACFIGLATDTGWFRHSNVDPAVMRMGADLIESGIDHPALYQLILSRDPPTRLRLLQRALTTLEYHCDTRIAIMSLQTEDFHAVGAQPTESGGFVDYPCAVTSVRVSVLMTELYVAKEGVLTKVSMRSKDGPDAVDVNVVAQGLGGGGHARAAGCRLHMPLSEARDVLLGALTPHLPAS